MTLAQRTAANTPPNEARLRGLGLDEIHGCVPCKAAALPSLIEALLMRHGARIQTINVSTPEPGVYAVTYTVRY